jgi:SAM-dependent methyltransferase
MLTSEFYIGSELEIFARATNWKSYWTSIVKPFIGSRVLEVGAGIGSTTRLLAPLSIEWTCVEPDPIQAAEIRTWCERNNCSSINVITGTLKNVALNNRYDTIIYIDVLEHIRDDRTEVNNAIELLKEHGKLIILVPAHQSLYTSFDRSIGHYRRYDKMQIESIRPDKATQLISCYLDSLGLAASVVNRFLLKASMPTRSQILFWDKFLIPISRLIDRLIGYRLGKSLVTVWEKAR